ncbi:hypothetical protein ValSw41_31 [Vibrio phage ValSw4_1]|nr:hypothetical protein ValSw41_31 [Vibrio phage ValSw4_1]
MLIKFNIAVVLDDHRATFIDSHNQPLDERRAREQEKRRRVNDILKLCADATNNLLENCSSPTVIIKSASIKPFTRYERGHTPAHDEVFRKYAYKHDAILSVSLELEWGHLIRFGSHNHALAVIDMAINNAPTLFTPRKYITLSKAVQRYEHY